MKCVYLKEEKEPKAIAATATTATGDIEKLLNNASIYFAQVLFSQLKWDGKIVIWYEFHVPL